MKRILIGALVATIIYFGYESAMWMAGLHSDVSTYTPKQDSILQDISKWNLKEELYLLPYYDPADKEASKKHDQVMQERVGKPWAMLFYHPSMAGFTPMYLVKGILYALIASFVVACVVYYGRFKSFSTRFLVSMSFAVFALANGILDKMNWWTFPWNFMKAQIIDITLGWALVSFWLAAFVKNKPARLIS